MFVKSYKITEPKCFEIFVEDIEEDKVLVRPEYLAICKADIRYYLGNRDRNTLKRKFPMSLVHEGIGIVARDKSGKFSSGQRVVMIPCEKAECDGSKCDVCVRTYNYLSDNYCPKSKFRSSNADGFSKEMINIDGSYLLPIPDEIGEEAVFAELISVGCCAMRRAGLWERKPQEISVWGDGIMGYIIALVARFGLGAKVNVIGINRDKLKKFSFAETFLATDIDCLPKTSACIEAVGGNNSAIAINQAIDSCFSGGTIVLCGVAGENAPINTRLVLEKGLSLLGSTRSDISDFEKAIELLTIPEFREKILALVEGVDVVDDIRKYYEVFETASRSDSLGKRIIKLVF
ncbi:MAG: alcohol dehydrogenase catalytic domain-containing protein [Clostridia bacterium]|nr:alcohol dehydrogenase catalytic domain-containing protein [Clostridia bacterium]